VARVEQFRCDGCGKLRSDDANHWWCVDVFKTGEIHIVPLSDAHEGEPHIRQADFCGQQCALAFISAQMAGRKG
jgi:hypothetical protein